jgi:serine/threonine-protein kinase mTOR
MWAAGPRLETLEYLHTFAVSMGKDLQEASERSSRPGGPEPKTPTEDLSRLLARCYFKLGEWQMELNSSWTSVCFLLLPFVVRV